jgi:glutamate-5-semialdehyde dehydrogenase
VPYFVDDSAEIAPALKIIVNAKTQRPSTCNTVETLLVHQDIADTFLPALSKQMAESGVTCTPMRNRCRRCKRPGSGRAGESGAV